MRAPGCVHFTPSPSSKSRGGNLVSVQVRPPAPVLSHGYRLHRLGECYHFAPDYARTMPVRFPLPVTEVFGDAGIGFAQVRLADDVVAVENGPSCEVRYCTSSVDGFIWPKPRAIVPAVLHPASTRLMFEFGSKPRCSVAVAPANPRPLSGPVVIVSAWLPLS